MNSLGIVLTVLESQDAVVPKKVDPVKAKKHAAELGFNRALGKICLISHAGS